MEDDEVRASPDTVFKGVFFTVVEVKKPEEADGWLQELVAGGAVQVDRTDENKIDLAAITHVISDTIEFQEYPEALALQKTVAQLSWVETCVRKGKVVSARQHSPDPGQYFQNMIVTTAELPDGDKQVIVSGVLAMGGQYSNPLSKLTTHIVTTSLDHPKCKMAIAKNLQCFIVTPHWFDDCLKLGKKIKEGPYRFPNPAIFRQPASKPVSTPSPHLAGAIHPIPTGLPSSTTTSTTPPSPAKSRKHLNVFAGQTVFFAQDLALTAHTLETFTELVKKGGGEVVSDVKGASFCICTYRDGDEYITASRAKKDVGNLSWFYHIIATNKYSAPSGKLLHYPIPRNPLPGFANFKISLSSYTGDARIYLQQLIQCSGALFTKTMKQENSHLVTAHKHSEKVEAAQEWDVNIVNHLWLEESYAKCAAQSLTNDRYTRFPPQTDLGQIVGLTRVDMTAVERLFFSDAALRARAEAEQASTEQPADEAEPEAEPIVAEQEVVPTIEPASTVKKSSALRKSFGTPRLADDEKENESPSIREGGRASKKKALNTMRDQAADIAQFQKEMKRKGGVTHGGRRSTNEDTEMSSPAPLRSRGKRSSEEMTYDATALDPDLSDGETQSVGSKPAKKAKRGTSSVAPPDSYMMVTGYKPWADRPKKLDADRTLLRGLGIEWTDDPSKVDILVAPRILRTPKFVSALARSPVVTETAYLERLLKQKKRGTDPKPLQDREGEQKYGFKLADALEKAKINNGEMFRGWSIFVSEAVNGGWEAFNSIIRANGGRAYKFTGYRAGLRIPPFTGKQQDEGAFAYLVAGDKEDELRDEFAKLTATHELTARVVTTDWLLSAAMRQEVVWNPTWSLVK